MNLRAPKEHGQILAVPALDQVGSLLQSNRHVLEQGSFDTMGRPLTELRRLARREVLAASSRYHQEAGATLPDASSDTWMVAGHQPELFHPGVWFKNFTLNQLARKHGAFALNLVVDTDTGKPALLHVPSEGRLARVAFDRSILETPYEARTVQEEATFSELPNRVEPITRHWGFEPMLPSFWQEVMRQANRTPLLGERFAAARRTVECRWGCVQHEVPMSRVCRTEAFAWFACSILDKLSAFHGVYNEVLRDYRRAHGIRSRHHPVSDLAGDGDWLEAPFWAWRRGEPRRGKLFVRRTPNSWTLRIGNTPGPTLPGSQAGPAVDAWRELEDQGYIIRSRALTTTMFARLFLADLFIHGIGGGIYDELTDRIIERFFAMPAPAFLVLSATLLLPLHRFPDAARQVQARSRKLRDLMYKPERYLTANERTAKIEALCRSKQEWIGHEGSTHRERVERYHRIRAVNAHLQPFVRAQIERVRTELDEYREQMKAHETASRRDYAFCLYPNEMLRTFFQSVPWK